jgi:hypothetical protein
MLRVEIQLRTYSQEMADKGASPGILIVDMKIQVFVDLSNGKKTRGIEIGRNASESLGGDVEGYWAANKSTAVLDSMLSCFLVSCFG